ncbi:Tab2/Atab2 family RNA-binding protein [Spirulina major CS-329]|uniref:Tab2 family RNA-binding protein n=1 Tax=Spirulina TaxID=1154 RepID=UPI00232E7FAB|nr:MULTISPECIES: Tab2 family RNA-binding protein [Spirulina]MDB9493703.1 Tab2/Atab2 family RNA-binding protein [Spirulina subsalsa CS-330]MDB9504727.1 Tab2/Atab2 family RNA-binding protein [Spirulina major CS-329]
MAIWQADLFRCPPSQAADQPLWYLLLTTPQGDLKLDVTVEPGAVTGDWVTAQLAAAGITGTLAVFRPQSVGLLGVAAQRLGLTLRETRRTGGIKSVLLQRWGPQLLQIESAPPQGIPDALWGDRWRFASIPAADLALWRDRPIPYRLFPDALDEVIQTLAPTDQIPGVVVEGGRRSRSLAQWLDQANPFALHYIPTEAGQSGGLILEAGLCDRWVFITFDDAEMATAASHYQHQLTASRGLHFLLVQPDDSGMTFTGFWLLCDR